ncbi:MAG TPA: SDR family oxidoreductase [Ilumatobacteraceae bacterium]|jgi:NAD(P)-dependent dehydrogenase (short-subunit alcohol dehydrogenase family)
MDLGLAGKKAIVTGSTKGIGRAIAETLLDEGASVAICARDAAGVDGAVGELGGRAGAGQQVWGQAVNAADGESLRAFVAAAIDQLGGLDIYVHNTSGKPAKSLEAWQNNMDIDLMALIHGVDAANEAMANGGAGALISISTSAVGEHFASGSNSYSAFKAAVANWTLGQAQVLGARGIRCNVVSPGPIWVEGGDWNRVKDAKPEFFAATEKTHPMGHIGAVGDVARAVVFLASPAAKHINGANLTVDGGFMKRVNF